MTITLGFRVPRIVPIVALSAALASSVMATPAVAGAQSAVRMVKDVNHGPDSAQQISAPNPGGDPTFTDVNGTLFFAAQSGAKGVELFKTDGTATGTKMVKDINPRGDSTPRHLTNFNGSLYFSAYTPETGQELWKSDGTAAGTTLVKDLVPGWNPSFVGTFVAFNDALYFEASDEIGHAIWKLDAAGAIAPLRRGLTWDAPTKANGTLYFFGSTSSTDDALWKTDGTDAGTVLVKDVEPDGLELVEVNGALFFPVIEGNGSELWKSDGTEAGTVKVKDINASPWGANPRELTKVGSTLFFSATDSELDKFGSNATGHGRELWKSDGTAEGTVVVNPTAPCATCDSNPQWLTDVNGTLFFAQKGYSLDGYKGIELFKTDGTDEGTVLVKDINTDLGADSHPAFLTAVGSTLYFAATDYTTAGIDRHSTQGHGVELWRSDGTAGGTTMVRDINTTITKWVDPMTGCECGMTMTYYSPGHSRPQSLTEHNGSLFFFADDGKKGIELWTA